MILPVTFRILDLACHSQTSPRVAFLHLWSRSYEIKKTEKANIMEAKTSIFTELKYFHCYVILYYIELKIISKFNSEFLTDAIRLEFEKGLL